MKSEVNNNAMDKGFRFLGDQWGRAFHRNLELPGIFNKQLQNDVAKDAEKEIRMDILELVDPDGEILKQPILINIEHQSTILLPAKIKTLDIYKNYSKCRYNYPLLTVIVTPFPKEKQEIRYESTQSDILEPVFIVFDDKEIEKRLNILKDNIHNSNIEDYIVLDIGMLAIFVENNRYEVLKELCTVLKESVGIHGKIRRDVMQVLGKMIEYKLKDEHEKVEELLSMIDEEIEVTRRGLRIWYEEEINQLESESEQKLNNQKFEYEQKMNNQQLQHEQEMAQKDQIILEKDQEMNNQQRQHEQEMAQKDHEINRLRVMMEEIVYSK